MSAFVLYSEITTEEVFAKKTFSDEEKQILDRLIEFRHEIQTLRKNSKGVVTILEVNAKASELSNIVEGLRTVRNDSLFAPRNRIDEVLDTLWMQMFFLWDKLLHIDTSLYPAYVSLVALSRSAEALKRSGSWTSADVAPLHQQLGSLDEKVAATAGKFLASTANVSSAEAAALGDKIPMGQAVMTSLQNRIHRTLEFLVLENESIGGDVMHIKKELDEIHAQLEGIEKKGIAGYTLETLVPISKRLHTIDSSRGPTGKYCNSDSVHGHATITGLLNICFDKLNILVANLDPVTVSSPLHELFRQLLSVHTDLVHIHANQQTTRTNPIELSNALELAQQKLQVLEQHRVDGTFLPQGQAFDQAVRVPGQATMHKLLHDCHALVSKIVEPVSLPVVGEALVSTYELLMAQRSALRRLRAYAHSGWDVRADVGKVEKILEGVEAGRVKGLFVGGGAGQVAESAEYGGEFWNEGFESGVPDGQAIVSALVDECDSLVWQIYCVLG